jgi:hypothetical protein
MSLVANIAPPAVVVLVCMVAWVSIRREHRKGRDVAPVPAPGAGPAE